MSDKDPQRKEKLTMHIMNALMTGLTAAATTVSAAATSTPKGWIDDYDAALREAAAENKLVLADFSGSDWCGWCRKLDEEVFAKDEFVEAAKKDFVLLMVDSPRDKSLLSEKAKEQNPGLVKKYDVHGFPTVLILDTEGKCLEKTGYRRGGVEGYLKHISAIAARVKDPDFAKHINPVKEKVEEAVRKFHAAMEADLLESHKRHLETLRNDINAIDVSGVPSKYADAVKETMEPADSTIKDAERAIKYFSKEIDGKKKAK